MPVLVAQAQAKREVGAEFPEVLHERARVGRAVQAERLEREVATSAGGQSQQEVREAVAGVLAVEIEAASRRVRAVTPVDAAVVEFVPHAQRVSASQPGEAGFG